MASRGPAWANLPNLLTLLRLLLVPVVIYYILDGRYLLAGWLFGAAGMTDILDGAAARFMGVKTPAGAYFDPIADKCLLSGVYLALAWAQIVPWWLVIVIFGRDIFILLGVALFLLFTTARRFPPSVWGKVSTFVQICTAVLAMARVIFGTPVLAEISSAMLWPCVGFTVWSGLDYSWKAVRVYRKY
ncbi:MAG TPA: CDP-alcohol phosphatidyltransferase family protein [Bryobacteraceae bacterium]|nr:CDP-alcohol phosphatidyltransferase family protein [Bryobacteraceae bacterium]